MKEKIIFVNNPAAIKGGALTILKEFVVNVALESEKNYKYYIFTNADIKYLETSNVKIIENIDTRKWNSRLAWDFKGIKKWSLENKISPNLLISLQNTAIGGFGNVRQIIYIHQSIPYYKNINWSIFKRDERAYWFYKNIYKKIIHFSVKNNEVIVQNEWMKKAIVDTHKIEDNRVYVVKPNVKKIDRYRIKSKEKELFYPASADRYKNHRVLIEAMNILKNEREIRDIRLNLTVKKDSIKDEELVEKINEYKLEKNINFMGQISYEEVVKNYEKSNIIVFPSYIETVGLPLLEAAQLGKKIIVSDLEYSREVLESYEGVEYVPFDNPKKWADKIEKGIEKNQKYKEYFIENDGWKKFREILKEEKNGS